MMCQTPTAFVVHFTNPKISLALQRAAKEGAGNKLPEQGELSWWSLAELELAGGAAPALGLDPAVPEHRRSEFPSGSQLCSPGPPSPAQGD